MAKTLTEMAVDIAAAQSSHASMTADEIEGFLMKTFEVLKQMQGAEEAGESLGTPAQPEAEPMDPKQSIQRSKVICIECGKEFKQLTNKHLGTHGLNGKEYRKKYGFSTRQALAAKSLVAKRRKKAKELGLGEKMQKARKAKAKAKKS
jgi:predicted transcriptional regulator